MVHELTHAEETKQVSGVTPIATESGQAYEVTLVANAVMEVALMSCQQMECTLGGTSVEHPQYHLLKVLTCVGIS
jgi:hypothetical protein